MYIARITVAAEETQTPEFKAGLVDESLIAGLRREFLEESRKVNPEVEFMAHYSNWTGRTMEHALEVYLYGDTLFIDPEDYFTTLIRNVEENTGKKIIITVPLSTEIPDVQTYKCPRCHGMGWYYRANEQNNMVVQDCEVCDTKQRVSLEVINSGIEPVSQIVEFFCQSFCKMKGKKTKLTSGVRACNDCIKSEAIQKEFMDSINTSTKVRNDEWESTKSKSQKEMGLLVNHMNQLEAVRKQAMKMKHSSKQ